MLVLLFNGFHLISLTVHSASLYIVIVLVLPLYTQVFLRVRLLALFFCMHIRPLTAIIDSHSITHDSFADDLSFDSSFADNSWQDIRDTSLYAVKSK